MILSDLNKRAAGDMLSFIFKHLACFMSCLETFYNIPADIFSRITSFNSFTDDNSVGINESLLT